MANIAIDATAPAATPSETADEPSFLIALLPIILVIGLNFVFTTWLLPNLDTSFLAATKYGSTNLSGVIGLWSIVLAVATSCVVRGCDQLEALHESHRQHQQGHVRVDAADAQHRLGGGLRLGHRLAFRLRHHSRRADLDLQRSRNLHRHHGERPRRHHRIGLGRPQHRARLVRDYFVQQAKAAGISMDILHRVATMASGGLDALPHNGAVITVLAICGLKSQADPISTSSWWQP